MDDLEKAVEAWFTSYRAWRYLDEELRPLMMDRDAAQRRLREATLAVVSQMAKHRVPIRPIGGPRPLGLPA